MKRNLKSLILITVIVTSILIGGCGLIGKDEANNQDSDKAGIETGNILPEDDDVKSFEEDDFEFQKFESVISEEETPYVLINEDGEKVYLDEMSPEVVALSMAVVKYGEATHNIDWEIASGREEYDLLTPEEKEFFDKEEEDQLLLDFYTTYKIKEEFMGVESYNYVEFNRDEAVVDVDYAFMYTNVEGIEGYETGVVYYAPQKLKFRLIDGQWLMDGIIEAGQIYQYEGE